MEITLLELPSDKKAVIKRLDEGRTLQKKLALLNIRVGKVLRKVAEQPFHGPVVIEIDHTEATIGMHMAEKIVVEPLEEE
jgi:ferrous iron transport protein A